MDNIESLIFYVCCFGGKRCSHEPEPEPESFSARLRTTTHQIPRLVKGGKTGRAGKEDGLVCEECLEWRCGQIPSDGGRTKKLCFSSSLSAGEVRHTAERGRAETNRQIFWLVKNGQ